MRRYLPMPDVQAAAGPLYTAALLLTPQPRQQGLGTTSNSSSSGSSSSSSSMHASQLITAVLAELEAACQCLAEEHTTCSGSSSHTPGSKNGSSKNTKQQQEDQDAGIEQAEEDQQQQQQLSKLSQPQLLSVLLFDLVLLEAWASSGTLHSCAPQEQQPQHFRTASAGTGDATAGSLLAVAGRAAVAMPAIAQSVCSCMQQLLQAGPSPGLLVDEDVSEQLLAVLQAVLQLSSLPQPQHALISSEGSDRSTSASSSSSRQGRLQISANISIRQLLLEALQLLVLTQGVPIDTQCTAVALLPDLVLQQPQQQTSKLDGGLLCMDTSAGLWQQLLTVLGAAVGAASPAVRGAAVEAAAQLAKAVWLPGVVQYDSSRSSSSSSEAATPLHQQQAQVLLQHRAGTAAALTHLPVLLQLLIGRCSDLDLQVAAAAQQHTAGLALPIYLLAASGVSLQATSTTITSSSSSAWVVGAALQPQQRGFKPAQLAQLFEQQMHASPLLLQRRHAPAAAGATVAGKASTPSEDQQQQLLQWHAQAEGLYRLAQSLPVLPPGALGATSSSKGNRSSKVPVVTFEALDSAAATAWLLLQEAARHCVNARLRTHLGNPTQSFNTLERLLLSMLYKLRADGSPAAAQRAWQQQVQQQLHKLLPQHQQHDEQQQQEGQQQQQVEPQQLLQTPIGAAARSLSPYPAAVAAAAAAAASTGSSARHSSLPPHHQQTLPDSSQTEQTQQQALHALRVAEQQRAESEAAAVSLLDFMLALEVNMAAAAEGSAVRPAVGKAVMAFFAGNKKVRPCWVLLLVLLWFCGCALRSTRRMPMIGLCMMACSGQGGDGLLCWQQEGETCLVVVAWSLSDLWLCSAIYLQHAVERLMPAGLLPKLPTSLFAGNKKVSLTYCCC
jgi:hypothetical protein